MPDEILVQSGSPGDDTYAALPGNRRIDAGGGVDTVTFNFRLTEAAISFVGNTVVILGPTGQTVLTGVERYEFTDGLVDEADGSPLIDDLFYYARNTDVWLAGADADEHYNLSGWLEGRDPNAFFGTRLYLGANADVDAANINPLLHYDLFGWREGRDPSLGFDTKAYLRGNPDVAAANIDPLAHFLQFGEGEGRQPPAPPTFTTLNGFDYTFYLQNNPDVAAAGADPLEHFNLFGWREGRDPNAYFDVTGYLSTYTDVAAAGINPLEHFTLFGWREGRNPSLAFDAQAYLARNPDVAAGGSDPLVHFLRYGLAEGRTASLLPLGDRDAGANTIAEGAGVNTRVGVTASWGGWVSSSLTYGLSLDTSGGGFVIDALTGVITVANPTKLDFETSGPGRSYTVTVVATSGGLSIAQNLPIAVTDVNETPPVFGSGPGASTPENVAPTEVVYTAQASDEGGTVRFSLGGTDAGLFTIDATTGAVRFRTAPDFEMPADGGANNVYDLVVTASDGALSSSLAVAITVTDRNDVAPVIATAASQSVAEGDTVVAALTATDPDTLGTNPAPFTLTGGADVGLFRIVTAGGAARLEFIAARDFETQARSYQVEVTASDGVNATAKLITVGLTDRNDTAPVFTSSATPSVAENTTAVVALTASDADTVGTSPPAFTITGGADAALFTLVSGNQLAFAAARDFELQARSYAVQVTANDGANATVQNLTVTLTDQNDNAPVFAGPFSASVAENTAATAVAYDANATDADGTAGNSTVSYSLSGADAALFTIDADDGEVRFIAAPNFEAPADAGGDNVYDVTVTASDGTLGTNQAVAITVTDQNDNAPAFTGPFSANVAENTAIATVAYDANAADADGTAANSTVGYALAAGVGDNDLFTIDADDGEIRFKTVPNFEAPTDAGAENTYDITVTASDGTLSTSQTVAITVTNLAPNQPTDSNNAADEVSNGVPANTLAGITAASTDPAGGLVTFALFDAMGNAADGGGRFKIDPNTGLVTTTGVPIVYDAGVPANNLVPITVRASDGTGSSYQTFTVTILPNAQPTVSAGGTLAYVENATATAINPSIVVADTDDATLTGATIRITGNFLAGQDVLGFVNTPNITGSFVGDTLTLTGADTVANYQAALRSVTYANTSNDPSGAARTISFTVNDGKIDSAAATATVTVTPVNDQPTLTATALSPTFTEDGAAADLFSGVTLSTVEAGQNLDQIVVTVTNVTDGLNEFLLVGMNELPLVAAGPTPVGDITVEVAVTGNTATVTLSKTGGITAAAASTLLDGLAYRNASQDPTGPARVVTIASLRDTGADGGANNDDNIANPSLASSVTVAPVNDAPTLTAMALNPTFTENGGPALVFSTAAASTIEAGQLFDGLTLTVAGLSDGADERLTIDGTVVQLGGGGPFTTATNGLTASVALAMGTATVTLSKAAGIDALALQALVAGLAYSNVSENPGSATRTVTLTSLSDNGSGTPPNDDTAALSIASSVTVTPVNDVPVIDLQNNVASVQNAAITATFTESATNPAAANVTPVAVVPAFDVIDVDSTTLAGATVTLTNGQTGDVISVGGDTDAGITAGGVGFTVSGSTITFSGTASPAAYEAAIQSVQFSNTSENPSTTARTFTIQIDDGGIANNLSTVATATVNVAATNDAPMNTVPADFTLQSGFTRAVTGLSVADVDAGNIAITTTLTAAAGTVTIGDGSNGAAGTGGGIGTGAAVAGNGTGGVTLTGTVAQINASLAGNGVVYTAPDTGSATGTTTTLTVATNDGGATGGAAITDTDVIDIGVLPQVWFIGNDPSVEPTGGPRGSQGNPFTDVAEFNTASGTATGPGVNDFIYVKAGTYTGEGINLKDGQTLLGDDQALSFPNPLGGPAIVIETASGARPTIEVSAANATDQAIDLASGNTIRGINLATTAGGQSGLDDGAGNASVGSLTVSGMNIAGVGKAIGIDGGGTLDVAIGTLTSSGSTTQGIDLVGTNGTLTVGGLGSISGSTGNAVNIDSTGSGGPLNVTYDGTITKGAGSSNALVNVAGGHTGTLDFNGNVSALGGTGLQFDNADGTYSFDGGTNSFNVGEAGIDILNGSGGTFTFSGGTSINHGVAGAAFTLANSNANVTFNGSISDSNGRAVDIDGHDGGTITFQTGSINSSGAGAQGISITNSNAGSVSFLGPVTLSTQTNNAVTLTNNGGSTVAFNASGGGLDITTTSGAGFTATGGGTVTVQGTSNTISSGTGTALNVANTMIGAAGLNFQSISSSGGTNGIVLNNTGTAAGNGSLTVTGTGTTDGSGGTIQNTAQGAVLTATKNVALSNMNFTNANAGEGTVNNIDNATFNSAAQAAINLSNVSTATFNNLNVTGNGGPGGSQVGINGQNVSNLTLADSVVTGFGDEVGEGNVKLFNLTGTSSVTNSTFNFAAGDASGGENLFEIRNDAGTLTLTATGNTFSNTRASNFGSGGLAVTTVSNATATLNIQNNDFLNLKTSGVETFARDASTLNVNITGVSGQALATGNTFDPQGGTGRAIGLNAEDTASLNFNINNNAKIAGHGGPVINVFGIGSAAIQGRINNNVDIQNDLDGSPGSPIRISPQDNATGVVEILGNTITNAGKDPGIFADPRGDGAAAVNAKLDITIGNNSIALTGAGTSRSGIYLSGGANANDQVKLAANVYNNSVNLGPGGAGNIGEVIFVGSAGSDVYLQGFVTDAAATWTAKGNTPAGSVITGGDHDPVAIPTGAPYFGAVRTPTNPSALALAPDGVAGASHQPGETHLTQAQLDIVVSAAVARWEAAGLSADQLAALHQIGFDVADLPNIGLGSSAPGRVSLDSNAAGLGWFVDPTPHDDAEFGHALSATRLQTDPSEAPAGHVDLLTTVMHEMGHQLGLDDAYVGSAREDLMYGFLVTGERRLADAQDVADIQGIADAHPGALAFTVAPAATPWQVSGAPGSMLWGGAVHLGSAPSEAPHGISGGISGLYNAIHLDWLLHYT